ncbi:carboxypeptidase N subunit 2-like [Anthonomus grandis grandis]|uniref:carboxypeptidase N subunit 2-like n=1 Tax=Anthonomus grandis grandis TaxID=2921223 RepID=UPI002166B863|nr:carboxypeptidase N subunit 2-like [Anthonomus grandis grandis]
MINLKFLIFSVLCLSVIVAGTSNDSLCSNDIYDKKCLCKKFTNEVTHLPTSQANCNGLGLTQFPSFSQLPEDITSLDLSMNGISVLEYSNASLSGTLQKLVLSYNEICDINDDFFEGFSKLRYLDLSNNNLTAITNAHIFFKLKDLSYLDLSYNKFKELPSKIFESLINLKRLSLSYNPLGSFLSSKAVLSEVLGISSNLSQLNLNNMGLTELHPDYFGTFKILKHIELQDNAFNTIPSLPYSMEYLDFSGNNLSYISAKYLNYHSLKTLRLSRMPSLVSVHHYAFYNLQSLETLVLTDCPNLNEFTELAFGLASKTMDIHPKTLNLARNGLSALNFSYAHMFRKMQHIDLRHNPWDCSCDLLWMQEFGAEFFKGEEIRCATPQHLRRKSLLKITHLDVPDCFPEIYGKMSHRITIVILMTTVIFLIGLIFYLIRYPKSWISPERIGLGPNSPYSPAPQDSSV